MGKIKLIHNNVVNFNTYKYKKYIKASGLESLDILPSADICFQRKRDIRKEMIKGYMKLLSNYYIK